MPEVVLLLETGMRRGELVGLHVEDIDRRHRLYHVRRSIAWVQGEPVERAPKCRSYRVCPLSERALQAVDALQQRYHGIYLISGDNALRPDSWSRKLKAEMARMAAVYPSMPQLTAHELRHTYGTYLRPVSYTHLDVYKRQTLDNPLITDTENAAAVAGWVRDWLLYRNTYEFEYRGNPELDPGDLIWLETQFAPSVTPARVLKSELSYSWHLYTSRCV